MTVFCSIIAQNYYAHALVLIQSVLHHHPEAKFYLLSVDGVGELVKYQSSQVTIIDCSDLSIHDLPQRRFKYNLTEFCTSVKAELIKHLLNLGFELVLYLDPDILVTRRLDEIFLNISNYDVFLTPHLDSPTPNDGMGPNYISMMLTGVYNLGFISVKKSPNAWDFLNWWDEQLEYRCLDEQDKGLFTDQKFLDIAPTIFGGFHIIRDTGYNVGPWNIHSRILRFENGNWFCNNKPLFFYHFSSYSNKKSNQIAPYVNRDDLDSRKDLKEIYDLYGFLLLRYSNNNNLFLKYKYNYFSSGIMITQSVRKYYRNGDTTYRRNPLPFDSLSLEIRRIQLEFGIIVALFYTLLKLNTVIVRVYKYIKDSKLC
jgi:hypothetical protein